MRGETRVILDNSCISEERLSGLFNYIKMSVNCFEEPYDTVEHSVQREGTNIGKYITPRKRLAVTLG